jgi:NAD(P)-dependent dehydrogenase (short-subunit alcohol dehydrogenase family)
MTDLDGRTIAITGATDGIGRLTAIRLLERGATLLVHGRNQAKLDETVEDLRGRAEPDRVRGLRADYSLLGDVRAMAERIVADCSRIDVLINNAGIGAGPKGEARRATSSDGHELRFQVNYLAHVMLTRVVLPALERAAEPGRPARIVNVASAAQAPIDLDDVMLERRYDGMHAYSRSKLAMVAWTFDLAEELADRGITANALHPGSLLDTKMVRESFGRPGNPVEEGVEAECHLAAAPEPAEVTGRYFDRTMPAEPHPQAKDPKARARLRALTEELLGRSV